MRIYAEKMHIFNGMEHVLLDTFQICFKLRYEGSDTESFVFL